MRKTSATGKLSVALVNKTGVLPFMKPEPTLPDSGRGRRQVSAIPGFNLSLGFTLTYLSLIVLIPLAGVFAKAAGLGWIELWAGIECTARTRRAQIVLWYCVHCRHDQRRFRYAGGLGVCPLRIPRQAIVRCHHRSALCVADSGGRHCPDRVVCGQRLGRPVAGAGRPQGSLYAQSASWWR